VYLELCDEPLPYSESYTRFRNPDDRRPWAQLVSSTTQEEIHYSKTNIFWDNTLYILVDVSVKVLPPYSQRINRASNTQEAKQQAGSSAGEIE
jgi:hypothetical protein